MLSNVCRLDPLDIKAASPLFAAHNTATSFPWQRSLALNVARFVSVITRDGKEYLIPNEDLITQQVINWSFSSEYVRIDVDFGVSYDSDPHEVSKLANRCRQNDRTGQQLQGARLLADSLRCVIARLSFAFLDI